MFGYYTGCLESLCLGIIQMLRVFVFGSYSGCLESLCLGIMQDA